MNNFKKLLIIFFALGSMAACGETSEQDVVVDDGRIAEPNVTAETATVVENDAAEYHVALDGDDANDGSAAAPFRTVIYGASVLQAGDTLIIHPGDYGQEFEIVVNSGTAVNPITIRAQTPGTVFLNGNRPPDQIDGGGTGFLLYGISYVVFEGLHFSNYDAAIEIDGEIEGSANAGHITIRQTTFKNNGSVGISSWESDNLLVTDSVFISEEPEGGFPSDPEEWTAVQDYGVAIYHSTGVVVEDSTFFGAHNQALSFKEGCHDGIARRNIFEGALYTAIYLGQNRQSDGRPRSTNLTAEYNIVRPAVGYRVKSPIRVDNVENAVVHHNYLEGFDETNNTSAVHVFDEAMGTVEIYNNILAFSVANDNSGGVALEEGLAAETAVSIHHNIIYSVVQDLFGPLNANSAFTENITWQCAYQDEGGVNNLQEDPQFINGDPVPLSLVVEPTVHDFDTYYRQLTDPFRLSDSG